MLKRPLIIISCVVTLGGCGTSAENQQSHLHDHDAAERHVSRSAEFATGAFQKGAVERHRWPVEVLSIGHTGASYQNYGGSSYFHHGLDIRTDSGSDVFASVGGKVVNIENYGSGPAYWEVAILDADGFLWQYHHVKKESIPQEMWDAYRSGGTVATGAKVGQTYHWMVETFGEVYHHIHLNVLGAGKKYLNPFDFLELLADDKSPRIIETGLLQGGRKVNGNEVKGPYSLFVTAHDLILHDQFVVPPQRILISVDGGEQAVVWDFSELPGGASNEQFVEKFFVPSLTCGNYDCRKLTVDLGFLKTGSRQFPASAGSHEINIVIEDYLNNQDSSSFRWQVKTN